MRILCQTFLASLVAVLLSGCFVVIPPAGVDRAKVQAPGMEDAAGRMLNAFRREHGLPPLSRNSLLTRAAAAMSADMQSTGQLEHVNSAGQGLAPRVRSAGYALCYGSENIGEGFPTDEIMFQKWSESPGHRKNMLGKNVTEYGYARSSGRWYTLIMASRC